MPSAVNVDLTFGDPDLFAAGQVRVSIDDIIAMVDATPDSAWNLDTVRSADGSRNCFFGHLFAFGERLADDDPDLQALSHPRLTGSEVVANALWEWFEECWATTYAVYPVNDGSDPGYPQGTPRERVLVFLHDLRSGKRLRTREAMEAEAAGHRACGMHDRSLDS